MSCRLRGDRWCTIASDAVMRWCSIAGAAAMPSSDLLRRLGLRPLTMRHRARTWRSVAWRPRMPIWPSCALRLVRMWRRTLLTPCHIPSPKSIGRRGTPTIRRLPTFGRRRCAPLIARRSFPDALTGPIPATVALVPRTFRTSSGRAADTSSAPPMPTFVGRTRARRRHILHGRRKNSDARFHRFCWL